MNKTKLGFPVVMMSIFMYLMAWYGGAVATIVVAGYILLNEDNEQLKTIAKRAVVLFALFLGVPAFIDVIGDVIVWLSDFFAYEAMFENEGIYDFLRNIKMFLGNIVSIVGIIENIVFAVLICAEIISKKIKIPVLDSVIEKYI